jgi:cell division protein FtsI (penicillin-binding protein 3)
MSVIITPPDSPLPGDNELPRPASANGPLRGLVAMIVVMLGFAAVGAQLIRLAMPAQMEISSSVSEVIDGNFARPDIVDRNGRLLATDVEAYSLFADPARVIDRDEAVERLATIFPDLDQDGLRKDLSNRQRRFVWVRRGLPPSTAQAVHDLGLPGFDFRKELRRAYPGGTLAGHVLGYVNIDNRGVAGIERYIDDVVGVEPVQGTSAPERAPVRLSLDIGVQHAVESELQDAIKVYQAKAAAGIVLDVETGEVLAAASLPEVDPARPAMSLDPARIDRIDNATYELGSVFKAVTLSMVLDDGLVSLDSIVDARGPLQAGRFTIKDLHSLGRPLTVSEVFVHSSNVGAAKLALMDGPEQLKSFLQRLDLTTQIKTELGPVAAPQLPERWGKVETMTIAFGHGLAVAPLQFVAAAGTLLNGGRRVAPTFLKRDTPVEAGGTSIVRLATSERLRELMRRNVIDPAGTGKRAEVEGYSVGGKTGTAEIPKAGGYREHAVISSFLATFPTNQPKYIVFVMLFEPKPTAAAKGEVVAGLNAAPTAGHIIGRIAPQLGMLPATAKPVAFDATSATKYEAR